MQFRPKEPFGKKLDQATKLESLAIYYSWPSMVNGANGDVAKAAAVFSQFDVLVIGATLERSDHPDYMKTYSILESLKRLVKTTVFGCVDLGNSVANPSQTELMAKAVSWKAIGVDGIFYDCASEGWGVQVPLLKISAEIARQMGLKLFYNSDNLDWALDNVLQPADSVLIEPVVYSNGKTWNLSYTDSYLCKTIASHPGVQFYGVGRFEQNPNPDKATLSRWARQYSAVAEWAIQVGLTGVCFTDNNYSVGIAETRLWSFSNGTSATQN